MNTLALPLITGLLSVVTSLIVYIFFSHVREDKEKFEQIDKSIDKIDKELETVVKYVDYEKHVSAMMKGFDEIKNDFKDLREYVNKLINKAPEFYVTQDTCDVNKDTLKTLLYEFKREWQSEKRNLEKGIDALNEKMDKLLITLASKKNDRL